jgi:hypothetical protein
LELAWRGYPWRFSLHSSEGALYMEEGCILRRRGAFIILHLLMRRGGLVRSGLGLMHWERRA